MTSIIAGAPVSILKPNNRDTIRSTVNPWDKATIFSIYPGEVKEWKRTIIPGYFVIPRGSLQNPARLVIGPSSWWRDFDPDQPLLEIPTSSIIVADSIVNDYCNARIAYSGSASPGIFYIPGDVSIQELLEKYPEELEKAIVRQRNWFGELVTMGDALWATTSGNPRAIPDDMRLACREMSIARDWATNFSRIEMVPCVACGMLRNPKFPICGACKFIVDREMAAKLGLIPTEIRAEPKG